MLSDTEKRRQYDLYGPMEERTSRPRYVHMYIIFTEISYSTETHVLLLFFLLFDLTNFFSFSFAVEDVMGSMNMTLPMGLKVI